VTLVRQMTLNQCHAALIRDASRPYKMKHWEVELNTMCECFNSLSPTPQIFVVQPTLSTIPRSPTMLGHR